MADYRDGSIECNDAGVRIHGYYFPWGTKFVPYQKVKGVRRVDLTALRGKMRIWGTANLSYWANLDVKRPSKRVGLILDVGKSVNPFITPDDPDTVESLVRERAGLGPSDGTSSSSPFL
ncbi:MAG: hypothetical protein WCA31_10435 [Acidimicrobiales bacterium]